MIQQSNRSKNTYVQFSFEKSLRKYNQPNKKNTKTYEGCLNINHNSCKHCLEKLNRKDSKQKYQRIENLQNYRKHELMKSRSKAREFSQTKRKKQCDNSIKKSAGLISMKKLGENTMKQSNQGSPQDRYSGNNQFNSLSEFKIDGQEVNSNIQKRQTFINRSQNEPMQPEKPNQNLINLCRQSQNQASIEKELFKSQSCQQKGFLHQCQQNYNLKNFQINQIRHLPNIKKNQQDQSFSHIKIFETNLSNTIEQKPIEKIRQKLGQIDDSISLNIIDYAKEKNGTEDKLISYAYFSSCSSLESLSLSVIPGEQKQIYKDEQNSSMKSPKNQKMDSQQQRNQPKNLQNPQLMILKLESKQQLKKQSRNQFRQRIFYKIKKIKAVQQAYCECQDISKKIIEELEIKTQEYNFNQQKEIHSERTPITSAVQNFQIKQNSQTNSKVQFLAEKKSSTEQNEKQVKQEIETNPSFKRDRKYFERRQEQSTKRKSMKLNFQVEQNYQCLGRIKISELGEAGESICLSIRRFSQYEQTEFPSGKKLVLKINKQRMVDYLIRQRPSLSNSKEQLMSLLSEIIDLKQCPTTKRLFQQ